MTSERIDISTRQIPTVRQAGRNPQLSSLAKARKSAEQTGEVRFVYPTHGAWKVANEAPDTSGVSYYEIHADQAFKVEVAFG
jgi:hypothetical protein